MARVLLAVPSFDRTAKALTLEALVNLDRDGNDVECRCFMGYSVARARNFMAQAALDGGFDYLLMCDSDMLPPSDGLANLMSHDVEVCLGWGVRGSSDDGQTSVIKPNTQGYHESYYARELSALDGLVEVKGGGMCFALINVDVFRRLPRPWFKYVDYPNGSALGEDYYFCQQCGSAGLKVHVDTRVGCGHIHDRILEAR